MALTLPASWQIASWRRAHLPHSPGWRRPLFLCTAPLVLPRSASCCQQMPCIVKGATSAWAPDLAQQCFSALRLGCDCKVIYSPVPPYPARQHRRPRTPWGPARVRGPPRLHSNSMQSVCRRPLALYSEHTYDRCTPMPIIRGSACHGRVSGPELLQSLKQITRWWCHQQPGPQLSEATSLLSRCMQVACL